ncbi:hypothetical protein AGMMS49942_16090 [Spirochaetia bacterium]|nr:hypothetical protein AGMMS49942_16090 [Spirochaetia bacterium]
MLFSFYQHLADVGLLLFVEGMIVFCMVHGPRLGIPTPVIEALQAIFAPYKVAFLKVAEDGNFGSGDVAVKDAAKAALISALDGFIGNWVRPNKNWTAADLIDAGFPRESVVTGGKIEASPIMSLDGKPGGYIKAHSRCRGVTGTGLAEFAEIIEILWDYKNADGTFPAAREILHTHCVISFSATASIEVPSTDKTREIVVYGRYVNHTGPGPWSDPVTIVIT